MRKLSFILLLLIGISAMCAVDVSLNIKPQDWNLSTRGNTMPPILEPGNPRLPYYPVQILIPFGEKVESVDVQLSGMRVVAERVDLDYVRNPQPTSLPSADLTVPNALVWNSNVSYPAKDFDFLGIQAFRGFRIAIINIYPWRYNPISKEIFAAESVQIKIKSSFDTAEAKAQAAFVTNSANTHQELRNFVLNSQEINTYNNAESYRIQHNSSRLIDLTNPKKMIVITDASRAPWFTEYVTWRNSMGVSTAVYLTEDIYADYTGVDNAEKVRNFIVDAYQSWAGSATPLEFVILGGDDEIVPERGARGQVGGTIDHRMPTDIYFSCLDGNWNANGNATYGEVSDNTDLIPEVHIGRFPAETQSEFNNIFRKTRHYVENDVFTNNIALMIGENLNWDPVTWGGDYKDDVAQHIPNIYHFNRLYQRDNTYSGTSVWNAINNGANIMNHMGHANEGSLMGQAINTVNSLQNTEFGFLYTQGCYPAAFDQRTSGDNESIGEHFVMASSALFAFIGNTRYGWYAPGSIDGASQFYDREFFIGMFQNAITELGKTLTFSRVQNLNAALSSDVMRWCYYEVVLFGDPSIEVRYPDAAMPYLSLQGYTVDDSEGDNDGTLNPGEIIRIHPIIRNHQDWNTAHNVSLSIEGLPAGSELLSDEIIISQIAPGATSSDEIYFRIQLGNDLSFGNYSVTLAVDAAHPQTGESVGIRRFPLDFSITLLDNRFPWESINATKSAPVVYDFDHDGSLDILYLDVFGSGHMIGNDGEEFDSFATTESLNINRSFAMGDLDGDGELDLAICSRTGEVVAIKTDGTQLFSYQTDTQLIHSPVIGDINGDGNLDIIVSGLNRNIYVFHSNGTLHSGFPITLNASIITEMAVADLDGDTQMEIICGTHSGSLYVIGSGGLIREGYPISLSGSVNGAPSVLDNNRIAVGTAGNMYLINPDGTIVFQKAIASELAGGTVPVDLNRDGELDIVAVSSMGMLYAVDQEGNDLSGFPVNIGEYFTCPPLVADVDNDMQYEVILHSYINGVYIYNHNGSSVPGFPFPTAFNGATPASLVDFDNDGYFKLISGFSNGVLMINLRKPSSERTPWTVYRGTLSRQGSYAATGYVSVNDELTNPISMQLQQNYPNPFNPETTISFSIPKAALTVLSIYNMKGQKVKTLLSSSIAAGQHQAIWNGKDDTGRSVSSGIYFYHLEADGIKQTRKMLLIK